MQDEKQWSISSVPSQQFSEAADEKIKYPYNRADFNRINESKADKVYYLLISKGNSLRFSLIVGITGSVASSPFSAPFGYPESLKSGTSVSDYYEAYRLIEDFLIKEGVTKICFYPPVSFFAPNDIAVWTNVLFANNYVVDFCDINYSLLNLPELLSNYSEILPHNGKKNLRIAESSESEFIVCSTKEEAHIVYEIVKANRKLKGHPLRMTESQIEETRKLIKSDMFLVKNGEDYIASALVYELSSDIAQVIYWADASGHSDKKPINFLCFELIKYYSQKGFSHLDIGISTEDGVPNPGLCDFKESIGCQRSDKLHFSKNLC